MGYGSPGLSEYSRPTPPDLGSFPLDRGGTCKDIMKRYLACLKNQKNDSHACRELSKQYLVCRMDNGLMTKEPLEKIGFQPEQEEK